MGRTLPADFAVELDGTSYRHVRPLAAGGMGEVHVVEHRELGGLFVLKVIRAELLSDEQHLTDRLRVEGRTLRSLRHPNLIEVVDFGFTSAGRAFLVTELLIGQSLKDALAETDRTLPFDQAMDVLSQTLAGLVVCHGAGVVHRDLKPDNLFWCKAVDGKPRVLKILDFGIAKILTEEAKARVGHVAPTATGLIVGTPLYLSPEQAMARAIDARTDIYALGCVAYHLLVGRPPFVPSPGPNAQLHLLEAHIREQPVLPTELVPALPRAIDAWVSKALAKAPEERFQSAGEALDALTSIRKSARVAPRGTIPMKASPANIEVASAPDSPELATPRLNPPGEPASGGASSTVYQSSLIDSSSAVKEPPPAPAALGRVITEVTPRAPVQRDAFSTLESATAGPSVPATEPMGVSPVAVRRPDLEAIAPAALLGSPAVERASSSSATEATEPAPRGSILFWIMTAVLALIVAFVVWWTMRSGAR